MFFLLRDGEGIRKRIGSIVPIEAHRYEQLIETISASIAANMYGVLAVAVALFSMIPLAGAASVWAVASIYLITIGHWGKAIFMLAWGAGVISTADNIVRPLVLSGRVKTPPAADFLLAARRR